MGVGGKGSHRKKKGGRWALGRCSGTHSHAIHKPVLIFHSNTSNFSLSNHGNMLNGIQFTESKPNKTVRCVFEMGTCQIRSC